MNNIYEDEFGDVLKTELFDDGEVAIHVNGDNCLLTREQAEEIANAILSWVAP